MNRKPRRALDWWCASPLLRLIVVVLVLAIVLMLAGCAAAPPKTSVLTVERKIYVPIPPALTADCPIADPTDVPLPNIAQLIAGGMSDNEAYWYAQFTRAAAVARQRKGSLQHCNADKAAIRSVQGTPEPSSQQK